ncbi:MAG: cohesin domain-containing protein, partial [Phycisphaerae bacterium]
NTASCNDGDACTTNDTCSGGACVGGPPPNCDDGNVCTDDSCESATGCVHTNNTASCNDGDACTTNDTCSGGACVGGPPPDCDDGNVCTDDSCDSAIGCVHTNNTASCDDGDACTTNDTCSGGTCVGGPPPDCDDGNVCTDDSCDVVLGCRHVNNTAPCDDGDACTTNDTCSGGACVGGPPPDCDDGNVCTDDSCESARGCVHTNNTASCDDGDACTTNDTCSGGACVGGPPPECEDGNVCTEDSCDSASGCVHTNNTAPCDDGFFCTADDVCSDGTCTGANDPCPGQLCDEENDRCVDCFTDDDCDDDDDCTIDACVDGACTNTPITCINVSDCPPGALCVGGVCVCPGEEISLCLEAVDGPLAVDNCYSLGDQIVVNVVLDNAPSEIVGGGFYIGYDPAALDFVSINPGAAFDPTSPFSMVFASIVDEVNGTIFYAVGITIGGTGTAGPAVMATLTFIATTECEVEGVCFLPDANPLHTRLTDADGNALVPPDLECCTGNFNINGSPPQINCPPNVVVNSDADMATAVVTWPRMQATDNCDGDLPFDPACTAIYWESGAVGVGSSVDISDQVLPTGGEFPQGITQITCSATNSCGVTRVCQFTVTVAPSTTLEVEVQLSPIIVPVSISRCIEFELYSDCVQAPLVDAAVLVFGPPWDLPGYAGQVMASIPAGQYICITARDPLHTLRAVADIEVVGTNYRAVFQGDPFVDGNWLVGGNLNGDDVIDILDFGTFVNEYLSMATVDTMCGAPGPHADINGDGFVDSVDFSFILGNFLAQSKDSCCPGDTSSAPTPPITEISVRELQRRGLSRLGVADLNGDGLLNTNDISAFTAGHTGPGDDDGQTPSRLDGGKGESRRERTGQSRR